MQDVHFTFFEADILKGEMILNVHEAAVWASFQTLQEYNFMKADRPIVNLLLKQYNKMERVCSLS